MQKIQNKRIIWIAAAFIVLACVPLAVKNNYYITLLNQLTINMIVVFGFEFCYRFDRSDESGDGGYLCHRSYISAILSRNFGISPWLTMMIAIGAGFLIGRGLGYPSLKLRGLIFRSQRWLLRKLFVFLRPI